MNKKYLVLIFLSVFLINCISGATWAGNYSTNLTNYWKFDETSGLNAENEINISNNGTGTYTAFVAGKINNAVNMTNVSARVDLNNIVPEVPVATINFWIKEPNVNTAGIIFSKDYSGTNLGDFNVQQLANGSLYIENRLGAKVLYTNTTLSNNTWAMITIVFNGTHGIIYKNTVKIGHGVNTEWVLGNTGGTTLLNRLGAGADGIKATYDELGIWMNRSLTDSELMILYNSGNGCSYGNESCFFLPPTITLNSPADKYNSSSQEINFNCTPSDDVGITNVSLYINGTSYQSNTSGLNNVPYIFTETLSDGYYDWNCRATDELSSSVYGINRTILIDTTFPKVNITYPAYTNISYHKLNTNLTINYTATDNHISSCWYEYANINTSVGCSTNTTNINITTPNHKNITLWANDTAGNLNYYYLSFDYKIFENSRIFNSTSFETKYETISINLTANSSLSAVYLNYNGTHYPMVQSGYEWNYSFNIPTTNIGINNITFNFTYQSSNISSSLNSTQNVSYLFFGICNATYPDVRFLNITFKDESDMSRINATIPSSSLVYYLGGGGVNKTLTYSNNTPNSNYTFCSNVVNSTLYVDSYIQYSNTSYPQRVYNPLAINYTNSTTNLTLYLLSSTSGLYVSFQVLNQAGQTLGGVYVNASREIGGVDVLVGEGLTGDDGLVTFWLNPDYIHDFYFVKAGYTTTTYTTTPTQSAYTITMGGETSTQIYDYTQGIIINIKPSIDTLLFNDTDYSFNMTISTTYWDLEKFGISLHLENGTILDSNSSIDSGGGLINVVVNSNNYSRIIMDYYYTINGTNTTGIARWTIINSNNREFSLFQFVTDLNLYLDSGFFGLDSFGKTLIIYLILFTTIGVFSFKYGFNSPTSISFMAFVVVYFFDVTLGLLTSPIGAIENVYTWLTGLICAVFFIKEVMT